MILLRVIGRRTVGWVRPVFWLLTAGLMAWLVARAWQRCVDPQIDFGAQVYLPWRITLGEHLGRDFVHPYGPLSSYYHAAVFACFGPSIRGLLISNLVIFAAIVVVLYQGLRQAFGFFPAAGGSLFGLGVIDFSHYNGTKNYTYLAPYSHEATHGLLLLLLLIRRVARGPGRKPGWEGLGDGLLLGLLCLTKVEIVFAAVVVLGLAGLRRGREAAEPRRCGRWLAALAAGCLGVLVVAWGTLAAVTSPYAAAVAVGSGFLAPLLYPAYLHHATMLGYLGVDHPGEHLWQMAAAGGIAGGALAGLVLLARSLARLPAGVAAAVGWLGVALIGGTILGGVSGPAYDLALAYPFLLNLGALHVFLRLRRERRARGAGSARAWTQALLLVAAVALLARMALAPRIYHYGFVQAMLATTWLAAFLLGGWPPGYFRSRAGAGFFRGAVAVALGLVMFPLIQASGGNFAASTQPMGEGADRIYGFSPQVFVCHENLEAVRQYLVKKIRPGASLLVVPEGILLNYWTRTREPLRITNLMPATLALNGRDVLAELKEHPPDYVVVATHLVNDDGYPGFGADEASGSRILHWIEEEYVQEAHTLGDPRRPFRENDFGIWVMARRSDAH